MRLPKILPALDRFQDTAMIYHCIEQVTICFNPFTSIFDVTSKLINRFDKILKFK